MTVGERIKSYREKVGMTQQDLADQIGLTNSAISLIESDKRGVTVEKLRKICDALDVTIADIVEG
jgi:transcriptional regulator with XRE-family HTH domain